MLNNTTESGSLAVTVGNYKWNSVDLNFGGLTGYVKTSNPVFSPDGKTMYIPTSTPAGHLFAIDVVSGEFKWVFAISQITYGGGALVAPDGTIYQCVRNATINNVYAINPNGTQKVGSKIGCCDRSFPCIVGRWCSFTVSPIRVRCMRWMHPVVLLNGNNRLTEQPVVLWLLIKPEMFMQVQVQPFILLNRIKSRIGNWKK